MLHLLFESAVAKRLKKICHLTQNNYICNHKTEKTVNGEDWCGSSAWLEYLPVTQGVAGSSPVRTA